MSSAPTRHAIDRDNTARSRSTLCDELRHEPGTLVLTMWKGRALLTWESVPAVLPALVGSSAPDAGSVALVLLPVGRVFAVLGRVYRGRMLVEVPGQPRCSAVIVTAFDADDRLLLGSNAMWEHAWYSLLAGCVEPGESFESAVEQEVHEEVGVRVVDVAYQGLQPWPFPASVMVGMTARLAGGQHGPFDEAPVAA